MSGRQPCLFEADDASRPLADRLRPHVLSDVVDQDHLLAGDAPIGRMVASRSSLWRAVTVGTCST
jgi:putative ATPase